MKSLNEAASSSAVHFNPAALAPGVGWVLTDVPPLPIGVAHMHYTCADSDERIVHRLGVWLQETTGGGEESQIARNDGLLRTIMCLAGVSTFNRNKKSDTTQSKRPDLTMLHHGVPILMVEEKEGDDIAGAASDLINKFVWIPHLRRLPFFIGFAFSFSRVRIIQIPRNEPPVTLFEGPCIDTADRYDVLKPAVNVARLLKYFINADLIHPAGLAMGSWHERQCGKKIKLSAGKVEVKCESAARFKFLKTFYNVCAQVPYLERAVDTTAATWRITLQPLGLSATPTTAVACRRAIACVATAAFGMHACGYVHTDIRWSNIVLLVNDDWLLIDCYEVCLLSNIAELQNRSAARHVTSHAWGPRDDLNQVAELLVGFDQPALQAVIASENVTLALILASCT